MTTSARLNDSLDAPEAWPPLPYASWKDCCDTLQRWLQIVGKVRAALSPPQNHWWHVVFFVTSRGLTTSPIPAGGRIFEGEFDFCRHNLLLRANDGTERVLPLYPRSVADFYQEVMGALSAMDIKVSISARPDEVANRIPFAEDRVHQAYDSDYVHRFWRVLVTADALLKEFRSGFVGKCSPVHFFWGGMDLAVTRFSGRPAPAREGMDPMEREAYFHEVSSAGFWPGDSRLPAPAFYAYAKPEPRGFAESAVRPKQAFYDRQMANFFLPYEDARNAPSPSEAVREFLHSTYEAAAKLGAWDRAALERSPHRH